MKRVVGHCEPTQVFLHRAIGVGGITTTKQNGKLKLSVCLNGILMVFFNHKERGKRK